VVLLTPEQVDEAAKIVPDYRAPGRWARCATARPCRPNLLWPKQALAAAGLV